jgi:hypothetical protein
LQTSVIPELSADNCIEVVRRQVEICSVEYAASDTTRFERHVEFEQA